MEQTDNSQVMCYMYCREYGTSISMFGIGSFCKSSFTKLNAKHYTIVISVHCTHENILLVLCQTTFFAKPLSPQLMYKKCFGHKVMEYASLKLQ